jgi:hypothetical protein
MSFAKLIAKAAAIADRVTARKASDLAINNDLPSDIAVEQSGQSITLISKNIRRRFITDANFRRRLR